MISKSLEQWLETLCMRGYSLMQIRTMLNDDEVIGQLELYHPASEVEDLVQFVNKMIEGK